MALPVLTKRRSRKPRTVTIELPPALELERVEAETPQPAISPRLRVAREPDGVAIWNDELFTDSAGQQLRGFLSRVFSLPEILAVEINRKAGVGRLKYGLSEDVPAIWRKLKQVLIEPATTHRDRDDEIRSEYRAGALGVDLLYLDGPASLPIRIGRIGSYLSTWRLRFQSEGRVRLAHPALRNRKDVAYRLEEELTAILGVRSFRTNLLASSVVVHFNPRRLNLDRLVRHLENALPRLLDGLEGPPPSRRFYASSTLITTSFVAQFFVPALLPFAVAGVAIYGASNVFSALKMLGR
jgi:cation-transporting P-type ATPase C